MARLMGIRPNVEEITVADIQQPKVNLLCLSQIEYYNWR